MHPSRELPSSRRPPVRSAPLSRLFRLGPWTSLTPSEQRAFAADRDRLILGIWPYISLLIAGAALLWWPLDPVVFEGRPLLIETLGRLRASIAVLNVVAYACSKTAVVRRFTVRTGIVFISANSALVGWWVGALGPMDGQWFSYFCAFPVLTLLLIVRPRARLVVLASMCACYIGGAALSDPAALDHRDFPAALSFMAFVMLMSFMLGHLTYVLFRSNFAFRRRLAEQRDELDALAAGLESRVAEQTDELRRLARRLESVRESERKAVAAEIHDQLGQTLTAIRYGLAFARSQCARAPQAADLALGEIQRLVAGTSETVRRLLARLNPRVLEELGLFAAIGWLVDQTTRHSGLETRITCEGDDADIPERVATGAFRIIQESVNNALKHACAGALHTELVVGGERLRLCVRDDGGGASAGPKHGGLGLVGIRERAQTLGGTARWGPASGGGFQVVAELPLAAGGES